jgi:hypothetical protein
MLKKIYDFGLFDAVTCKNVKEMYNLGLLVDAKQPVFVASHIRDRDVKPRLILHRF